MALDRLLPVSTTPGAITGDAYMDAVQEEVTGLWDRSRILLSGVSGTNTITATVTPALTAGLVDGMQAILRPANTNSGAVTLNGVAVKDGDGTALTASALRSGGTYDLVYVSALTSWIMVGYFPGLASGTGIKLIKTQVASASATIDFVNGVSSVIMDDTYDAYEVRISSVRPATDATDLLLRVGTGAGPTYQVTNYDWFSYSAGLDDGGTAESSIPIAAGMSSTPTSEVGDINVSFSDPEVANKHVFKFDVAYTNSANVMSGGDGAGRYSTAIAITAIRFLFSSGNIAAGRFSLYAYTKV